MTKSAVPETCPMYTWTLSASNFCHFLLMTSVNHFPQSPGSPSCESHSMLLPCHLQTEVSGKNPLSGITETQLLQTDLLGQACAYGKCHLIQSSRNVSLGCHWSVSRQLSTHLWDSKFLPASPSALWPRESQQGLWQDRIIAHFPPLATEK